MGRSAPGRQALDLCFRNSSSLNSCERVCRKPQAPRGLSSNAKIFTSTRSPFCRASNLPQRRERISAAISSTRPSTAAQPPGSAATVRSRQSLNKPTIASFEAPSRMGAYIVRLSSCAAWFVPWPLSRPSASQTPARNNAAVTAPNSTTSKGTANLRPHARSAASEPGSKQTWWLYWLASGSVGGMKNSAPRREAWSGAEATGRSSRASKSRPCSAPKAEGGGAAFAAAAAAGWPEAARRAAS
mmetsp:Transcript_83704/g.270653  ORF Transcript_83704/g.270653 Transcript_83704/m.270653 type:complete len:243 (-) Transcript_83704:823-1551(-)